MNESQSCIKTRCTIDKKMLLKWLLTLFPECKVNSQLREVQDNFNGSTTFTIEHTQQPSVPLAIKLGAKIDVEIVPPAVPDYQHVDPEHPEEDEGPSRRD